MRITLKQLQIFEMVAEQQSYTLGAKLLYLSQPAVSMQIKQLEDEIGMPVFDRIGKTIQLTDAGRELLLHARGIQIQLEEAQQSMEELRGIKRGRLHLTMASTANYFTPKLLAGFCREYPDIQISLSVANRAGLLTALENNTTDMVIMGQPPGNMPLAAETFMENPLVVVAPPKHRLVGKKNISLSEIAQESFIVREIGSGTRAAVERFLATHDLERPRGLEMNSSEAIKQAVQAGLGLGVVSMHTLEMELALNRLVVLDAQDFPIMRHWLLVYRKDRHFSPVSKAFHDYVLENAETLLSTEKP
ncbi:MAG TPA: LysR family transcriptional regulator [Mariprofundaceae bacterium]|nr:LysR family transcriptional regulator [Mariprofundaceae bacterium]